MPLIRIYSPSRINLLENLVRFREMLVPRNFVRLRYMVALLYYYEQELGFSMHACSCDAEESYMYSNLVFLCCVCCTDAAQHANAALHCCKAEMQPSQEQIRQCVPMYVSVYRSCMYMSACSLTRSV